ncbi:MAG: AAA family ATPase, partial [Acidobacteria bacterium]|nr:AAA family ATPase [Acidobacteriota bacterium]
RAAVQEAIVSVLADCLLEGVSRQIIGTLSKGFRQRVGLATAILHQPDVLVLDEPTVGLDPKQIIAIRELIRQLGSQRTLLLSTHILPEVDLLCDRVVIIDRGRVIAEGTPESLRQSWQGEVVIRLEIKNAVAEASQVLAAVPGVTDVESAGNGCFELRCRPGSDLREEVFRLAVQRQWTLLELALERASLEDIFVRLTTGDAGEVVQ